MTTLLALGSLATVLLFWQEGLLALLLLVAIAVVDLTRRPEPGRFTVYLVAMVFGPLTETLAIERGAWAYTEPDILGIPIWLPFLWGNAGLFLTNVQRSVEHRTANRRK